MTFDQHLQTTPSSWQTGQAVVFDWYDGPRQGLCRLSQPPVEFVFRLLDERSSVDDLDDRLFRLEELPPGSVERALTALADLGRPADPVWVPVWRFSSAAEEQRAEAALRQIEQAARPTAAVIHTRDLIEYLGCWTVAGAVGEGADWFGILHITPRQTA